MDGWRAVQSSGLLYFEKGRILELELESLISAQQWNEIFSLSFNSAGREKGCWCTQKKRYKNP